MLKQSLAILVITVFTSCGDSDSPPVPAPDQSGTGHAVLAERAKVLDEQGLAALTTVEPGGRFVFSSMSPVLQGTAPGDVLIIGVSQATPRGAMVKVDSVAPSGAGMVLGTRPALMEEAFEELQLTLQTVLTAPETTGLMRTRSSHAPPGLTFPLNLGESTDNGRVDLAGSLSLAPTFDLALDIDFLAFKLKELSMSFGAQETFLASLVGQGNVGFNESVTLGSFAFTPIIITVPSPAGLIPLVFTPQVRVEAGLQGSIQGTIDTRVTQEAGFTAGVGYKNGEFGGFSDSDSNFTFDQPSYEAGASVKAFAGPRLEVLLYGLVGPFASVEAFVEAGANLEGPPPCATGVVNAGLTAKAGVDLLADYETTLFNKSFELASFNSCTNDPSAPRPAITWARALGREGSLGERASAVIEASDGTYLVVGDSDLFGGIKGFAASLWAVRLDNLGNVMWQRAFGRLGRYGLSQGAQQVRGGFLLAGTSGIIKIDSGGNIVWGKGYDNNSYLAMQSIATHPDGSSIVAGLYGTTTEAWAMKLDASGDVVWSRRYGGRGFSRARITRDGGAIIVGEHSANVTDAYLVKLDQDGNVIFQRTLDNRHDSTGGGNPGNQPSSGTDRGFDVVEKPDGGYLVVGESVGSFPIPEPSQAGFYAAWLAELNAVGDLAGITIYRSPQKANYGSGYALAQRQNGSTIIVGRRADNASDLLEHEDILVIQGGAFSMLGAGGNDAVRVDFAPGRRMPLQLTLDGGAILAATSDSFAGREQFWLVKLNRTGSIHFPYTHSLPGTSYANEHAVSQQLSSESTDAPIQVSELTSELQSEVTSVVDLRQAP